MILCLRNRTKENFKKDITNRKILRSLFVSGTIFLCSAISFTFMLSQTIFAREYEVSTDINYDTNAKRDLLCLMLAYPEHIRAIEKDSSGKIYVVMKSGCKLLYDDKRQKNYEQKLANPDLQDMMEQIYPMHDISNLMAEDSDPGRIRVYPLMREVYGSSREAVQSNLVNVNIGYQNCQFNRNNRAAESLKAAMKEVAQLTKSNPKIGSFVFPTSGTFNYRVIAGTGRLSPHSFGTAIDLKSDKKDYWKWTPRKEGQKRLNCYPRELVQVFEKNNFIWGGKWGHFDILHFEYRPELTIKGSYFSSPAVDEKSWYIGVPEADENIKIKINKINEVFGG